MQLHVLYNGGDGTYDVVNIKDDGTLEYVAEGFMDGKHAAVFIEGWHAAGEYAAPEYDPAAWTPHDHRIANALDNAFRYRD